MLYSIIIDMAEFDFIDVYPITEFLFGWLLTSSDQEEETQPEGDTDTESSDATLRRLES